MTVAAASPSPFWFLTRGTGATALVLLSATVMLGVLGVRRTRPGQAPRFVLDALHRDLGLTAVVFVLAHVATTLLDGYAPISVTDAVVPFRSAYRPAWVGLGAVALDLLLAVALTSLVRRRLGYRAWRGTHWLAYASWPIALLHGFGTGTDARTHWMLLLCAGCLTVVLAAVAMRVSAGWPTRRAIRLASAGAAAALPLGLALWLPTGPLAAGWARRAGTPVWLLAGSGAGRAAPDARAWTLAEPSSPPSPASAPAAPTAGFRAAVSGRVRQAALPDGLTLVDLPLVVLGQRLSNLRIRLRGVPLSGGGVEMTGSRVTLGTPGNPDRYAGHLTSLSGTRLTASLSGAGVELTVDATLQIASVPGPVSGQVAVSPEASSR